MASETREQPLRLKCFFRPRSISPVGRRPILATPAGDPLPTFWWINYADVDRMARLNYLPHFFREFPAVYSRPTQATMPFALRIALAGTKALHPVIHNVIALHPYFFLF
jgi:hypothetical protein